MKNMHARNEAGSALLLAAIALLVMAGIGAALLSLTLGEQKTTLAASNADAAYHFAEAGIDDAINKLKGYQQSPDNTAADFNVIATVLKDEDTGETYNEITGELQGGSFYVTITPAYAGLGDYKIESIGMANGEKRGITTWVSAEDAGGPFKYGLFGDVYVDAGGTITTDGYRSDKGAYLTQITKVIGKTPVANMTGHIGSNGDVTVKGSSIIYGNATPGPDGKLTGASGVYGDTTPSKSLFPLPDIDFSVPSGAKNAGAVGSGTTLGAAGTTTVYTATSVSPTGKGEIVIEGDVTIYVTGNFDFSGQTKLVIKDGASLKVYQNSSDGTAQFKINGGSVTNTSKIPSNLQFNTNTKTGTLNGNADFYGTIYAPKTDMKISGTAGLYGASVAQRIDITGTPFFHYDESLADVETNALTIGVKSFEQFVVDSNFTFTVKSSK